MKENPIWRRLDLVTTGYSVWGRFIKCLNPIDALTAQLGRRRPINIGKLQVTYPHITLGRGHGGTHWKLNLKKIFCLLLFLCVGGGDNIFFSGKIGWDQDEIWSGNRTAPIYHPKNTCCANGNIK